MAAKKAGGKRGGPRLGAGRPKGSGGPAKNVRRNRVVAMLSDSELAKLQRLAHQQEKPLGTCAYEIIAQRLKRCR